jgi:phosphohistidine phosphatase SixA
VVYLVRHAHAGNKRQWRGRDGDRPLSLAGHQEAHGLVARLRDYPVARILTSPAVRCQQTVEPLSQRRAVPVELVDALAVDAPPGMLLKLVTEQGLQQTVLCGHGEQIGQLVTQLADRGLLDAAPPRWAKGSTWILDSDDGHVVGARYLAPLRLKDLAGCH